LEEAVLDVKEVRLLDHERILSSFLRGVYINVGEILNFDWLKSYIYFPYTPTQLISKNVKKQEIL
jgi:hypothetical protein